MKPAVTATLALLLLAAPAAPSRAATKALTWRAWRAGLTEAQNSKRPVLVDVYTQWCGWCRRMDRDVYARPDVRAYLDEKFVVVKMDAEASEATPYQGQEFTARELAEAFHVTGYPTTLFLRANGEHLVTVPGYVPADRFLLVLRYIGDGHMDRGVSWDDFVAKAGH